MTLDKGYPDWLVLSARLLAQPSCGQVGGAKYICLITFPCGYVKILQPVAICTVIFVTVLRLSSSLVAVVVRFVPQTVVGIPQCLDHRINQLLALPQETHPVPCLQQRIHSPLNQICTIR